MRPPLAPVLGFLTVAGLLWLAARKSTAPALPRVEPSKPAPIPPPPNASDSMPRKDGGPDQTDDTTALARMLASETTDDGARVVIGWMAIQTARNRKQSVFDRLTAGKGYGPQQKDGVVRYASTAKTPTPRTRELASQLLADKVVPSERIRARGHSAWVEDLARTEQSADALLRKQAKPADFGGIWARIRGTRWYLYNPKSAIVRWEPGSAQAALRSVPEISPTDDPIVV